MIFQPEPLTRIERKWRQELLTAVIPQCDQGISHPGLGALDLKDFWALYYMSAPPLLKYGIRASIWMLTWLPCVCPGFWRPFHLLSAKDRDRFLMLTLSSRFYLLRQASMTLKVIACYAYFMDPDIRMRIDSTGE